MFRRWPKSNFDADNGVDSAFYFLTVSSRSMRNPLRFMKIPASDQFAPVSLIGACNGRQSELPEALESPAIDRDSGATTIQGMPFDPGPADGPNIILLTDQCVTVELSDITATYIIFLHLVADRIKEFQGDFSNPWEWGQDLGDHVSDYILHYQDGSSETHPILRRFAIQQHSINWGDSAFSAATEAGPLVRRAADEDRQLGLVPDTLWGGGESRHMSGRDRGSARWLYALANPHPDKSLGSLTLQPRDEQSVVFGITVTNVAEHPLRPQLRRKLLLKLPDGATLNAIGELDDIAIDLGTVISARAQYLYTREQWAGSEPLVMPEPSEDTVVVEYAAHPKAKLYVGTGGENHEVYSLEAPSGGAAVIAPAHRPVRLRVIDKQARQPLAVRLHLHGEAGEYLPPRGYHRRVNPRWFEDKYAEFVYRKKEYVYISGDCIADLPLGTVYVEITRGHEITPIRDRFTVTADTDEITFELERVLDWRSRGWVTADTHVHFLSPATAQLEGAAEDVNVVNVLASQWGEMFSNVGDFDGRTTHGAVECGGNGEFLVRVGSENRMQVLGHISLLGYGGQLIHPLCSGGPGESAIGDPQELCMAEWAQRCRDQGGLVVMPHAPNPQCERAADFVLGLVDANEMMVGYPFGSGITPVGLADWYKYLNLGYHLPVVGGSDKMSAGMLLGGCRTYAHLGDLAFTYENWMASIRAGNTFVSIGPLVDLKVEGQAPGSTVSLPESGGTVDVTWRVESVHVPIYGIEVVAGAIIEHEETFAEGVLEARGSAAVAVNRSTWIALRVRGSYGGRVHDIAAHSSAVQVLTGEQEIFSQPEAGEVLKQIEGTIAYIDTMAPRPEAERFRQMRATLEGAYNRLHQRMHRQGMFHQHTPLHDHPEHE